jgi:hypothetical protein
MHGPVGSRAVRERIVDTSSNLAEQTGSLGFATVGTRIAVPYIFVIR